MDLFVLDLRRVPASAQRFDQRNLGHHLLAQQLRRQPLIGQQRALRGDHVEVGCDSADIAIVGDFERALRSRQRPRSASSAACDSCVNPDSPSSTC